MHAHHIAPHKRSAYTCTVYTIMWPAFENAPFPRNLQIIKYPMEDAHRTTNSTKKRRTKTIARTLTHHLVIIIKRFVLCDTQTHTHTHISVVCLCLMVGGKKTEWNGTKRHGAKKKKKTAKPAQHSAWFTEPDHTKIVAKDTLWEDVCVCVFVPIFPSKLWDHFFSRQRILSRQKYVDKKIQIKEN